MLSPETIWVSEIILALFQNEESSFLVSYHPLLHLTVFDFEVIVEGPLKKEISVVVF